MKKIIGIIIVLFLFSFNAFAHENHGCYDPCEKQDYCPMCKFFSEDGLAEKSKDELLKLKDTIQEHLTKENINKMGKKAASSLSKCLESVNEKLDSYANNQE